MIKQIIGLIILSIVTIFAAQYIKPALNTGLHFYDWIRELLKQVFAHGAIGDLFINMLPLFLIPLVIAGIVALIYWIVKHGKCPWFVYIMWVIWLVLATLIVMQ